MYGPEAPTRCSVASRLARANVNGVKKAAPITTPVSVNATEKSDVTYEASGRHLLLTLRNCSPEFLSDEFKLRELTLIAAQATGATVLKISSHRFAPQGVTTLALLAESHASLHSYPEANLVFWDCFTCGSTCNPELSIPILVAALKAASVSKQVVARS